MYPSLKVGVIGDFDSLRQSQTNTNKAIEDAAYKLSVAVDISWLPTKLIEKQLAKNGLSNFDAILCGPGDYANATGAMKAITICRENDLPFIGT